MTVVAAILLAGTACGSSGSKSSSASAVASSCVVASTTTSSTLPGSALPVLSGAATVPTTVVKARCLPTGDVGHAIQVAEAIKASGLGCDTADLVSVSARKLGVPDTPGLPKSDVVDCEIGDDDITITLYADHATLLSALPMVRQGVCFVNATQPGNLTYAQGNNWIVFPERAATAVRLAPSLHSSVQTVHCHGLQPTP